MRFVKPILRPHRHLAAHLSHLPYCSGHAVSIVEIERRKARREWRDLVAGIEGGQRFGTDRLQFGWGVCIAVGHYDNMCVDCKEYSTRFWASSMQVIHPRHCAKYRANFYAK